MESSVFRLQSGVKPKKIPIAEPSAIECGVSAIVISVMWWATNQRLSRASGCGNLDWQTRVAVASDSCTAQA